MDTDPEREREGVPAGYRTRMLVALSLGWAVLQCGRFALSPLLPRIQSSLGLSSAVVGLVLTLFGLVYAVGQYPAGVASDRLSRATLLVPGLIVIVASFAVLALSLSPWLFVLAVVLLGAGKALYASPSRALLGDLYGANQGRALGIYSAGTDLGGLVAAGLAVVVLATTTWRAAYVPIAIVLTLVAGLFVVWNREPYTRGRVALDPHATVDRVLGSRTQRAQILSFSLFFFVVGGLTNFYPTFLVNARGLSEGVAGASFALIFLVGLLVKPTAGVVSDRFPRLLVSVLGLLTAAAGLAIVVVGPGLLSVAVGTVLTALGYKTQFPIADAVIIDAAPAEDVGGDLGAARAAFLSANALGPGVVGVIAYVGTWTHAFALLALGYLAAAALLAGQYRRR